MDWNKNQSLDFLIKKGLNTSNSNDEFSTNSFNDDEQLNLKYLKNASIEITGGCFRAFPHNVRSLNAQLSQIVTSQVYLSSDIGLLKETWDIITNIQISLYFDSVCFDDCILKIFLHVAMFLDPFLDKRHKYFVH